MRPGQNPAESESGLLFRVGGSLMIVGVPRETFPGGAWRVALVPAVLPLRW